jgi:hypothetical protein
MSVAQGSNLLEVKWWPKAQSAGNKPYQMIGKLTPQITWLDFSGAQLPDSAWRLLPNLTNLTRLHLQGSNVTDAQLPLLKNLNHLEYLNLYGTAVTDAGLMHLQSLKKLTSLYLWQTKVSPGGVKELQKKLPALRVDTGWEEKTPPAQDTLASPKKGA